MTNAQKKWKPAKGAMAIIRAHAARVAECSRPDINVASRAIDAGEPTFNILDLWKPGAEQQDDLYDNCHRTDVLRGLEPGAKLIEFWVYSTGEWGELKDQLLVWFADDGRIIQINETSRNGRKCYQQPGGA